MKERLSILNKFIAKHLTRVWIYLTEADSKKKTKLKNSIVVLFICLMCCFLVIPPMFLDEGLFDVTYSAVDCDKIVLKHGKYHTNAFAITLFSWASVMCMAIPYLFSSLHSSFKWISILGGSWIMAGLIYQISAIAIPDTIFFANIKEKWTVVQFSSLFTIGIFAIILNETWNHQKNSSKS